MSDANIQLVQKVYEKFMGADLPGLLSLVSEDSRWDHRGPEGVPINRLYEGRDDVANFLTELGESQEVQEFEPREFFADGDRVVAIGFHRFRVNATGKVWESDWAHLFTIRDNLVAEWRPIHDMGAEAAAFSD